MIEIVKPNDPIAPDEVDQLEARLGVKLPSQYKELLVRHNGGRPRRAVFSESSIEWFLAVRDAVDSAMIEFMMELLGNRIPRGAIPIASDGLGNYVLVVMDGDAERGVYFWDHEREGDKEGVLLLAPTFDEFVASLREETPSP